MPLQVLAISMEEVAYRLNPSTRTLTSRVSSSNDTTVQPRQNAEIFREVATGIRDALATEAAGVGAGSICENGSVNRIAGQDQKLLREESRDAFSLTPTSSCASIAPPAEQGPTHLSSYPAHVKVPAGSSAAYVTGELQAELSAVKLNHCCCHGDCSAIRQLERSIESHHSIAQQQAAATAEEWAAARAERADLRAHDNSLILILAALVPGSTPFASVSSTKPYDDSSSTIDLMQTTSEERKLTLSSGATAKSAAGTLIVPNQAVVIGANLPAAEITSAARPSDSIGKGYYPIDAAKAGTNCQTDPYATDMEFNFVVKRVGSRRATHYKEQMSDGNGQSLENNGGFSKEQQAINHTATGLTSSNVALQRVDITNSQQMQNQQLQQLSPPPLPPPPLREISLIEGKSSRRTFGGRGVSKASAFGVMLSSRRLPQQQTQAIPATVAAGQVQDYLSDPAGISTLMVV